MNDEIRSHHSETIDDILNMAKSEEIVLPKDDEIKELNNLVQALVETQGQIATFEEKLKALKASELRLSTEVIPAKMDECGFTSVTLPNGRKVSYKAFYSGKIRPETEPEAFDWLENSGHGGVIKGEAVFPYRRAEKDEMLEWLRIVEEATGRVANVKLSVHHSTLKALVREIVEGGGTLPPHLFDVYIGRQTVLK